MTLPPVYVYGYPGPLGGACTEAWHVLKLWRRHGLEVRLLPTWTDPPKEIRDRCGSIGCTTHRVQPKRHALSAVEGLRGAVVVSFCNDAFLAHADLFRELGCRVVWVNCMNWLHPLERRHYRVWGPFDRYVLQSRHQQGVLAGELSQWGVPAEHLYRIRGAFDPDEFRFAPRPHAPGEPFVIGRLSRPAPNKFSTNTWPIWERVDYEPKQVRILGWDPRIARVIGQPPEWAECLPPNSEPVPEFLGSLHCYSQITGDEQENWPRTGLEAMAAGVPIVVEARGGWTEMIEHGKTGFCCQTDAELAHWIAHLAYDEAGRREIVRRAWLRLVRELAEPEEIWRRWAKLFESLIVGTRKHERTKTRKGRDETQTARPWPSPGRSQAKPVPQGNGQAEKTPSRVLTADS